MRLRFTLRMQVSEEVLSDPFLDAEVIVELTEKWVRDFCEDHGMVRLEGPVQLIEMRGTPAFAWPCEERESA